MTNAENQIAHLKAESSQTCSPEAQPIPTTDAMKSAFAGNDDAAQEAENKANGTPILQLNGQPALGDPLVTKSGLASPPEETGAKKWGITSLLSRGRSDSVPSSNTIPAISTAPAAAAAKTGGGWFSKNRSRHSSRASSADPVLSASLPEVPRKSSNAPIVGGLPVIEGPLPGDDTSPAETTANGDGDGSNSPRRGISVSAPVSTNVTPVIDPLLPPGMANGKDKKGHHRRHRSLLETLGWSKGSRSTASTASTSGDLDTLEDNGNGSTNGDNGAAAAGHDENGSGSGNANANGKISTADIELLEVELPPSVPFATRGMSNMGNTCFLNAALQCLRHTPGLPLILVPDLMQKAEQRAKEQIEAQEQAAAAAAVKAEAEAEVEAKKAREEEEKKKEEKEAEEEPESASKETVAALAKMTGTAKTTTVAVAVVEASVEGVVEVAAPVSSAEKDVEHPVLPHAAAADGDAPVEAEEKAPEAATTPAVAAPPTAVPVVPVPRPSQGELADSVASLFTELFLNPVSTTSAANTNTAIMTAPAITPLTLLSVLRRFPTAADYFDGRQQDCQEVLQILLDLLHEDLNRVKKDDKEEEETKGGDANGQETVNVEEKEEDKDGQETNGIKNTVTAMRSASNGLPPRPPTPSSSPAVAPLPLPLPNSQLKNINGNSTDESLKANSAWSSWRRTADSPISDLFMGQLQSSVTCSKCSGRFTMYEPFWELSLPLAPSSGGAFSWLTFKAGSSSLTLQDCLRAYTAGEKLDGKEAFSCEKCGEKTAATKHLRLHRLPDALVLHVKRFKYGGSSGGGDKLSTDVQFPLHSLDLSNHLSPESLHPAQECIYDLYAISYHTGSLAGGHYLACCRLSKIEEATNNSTPTPSWYMFNDETVTPVAEGNVKTQNAYILFYARRKFKDSNAAAAVFASRDAAKQGGHHRRSASSGGSGSGGAGFLFGNRNKEKAAAASAAASPAAVAPKEKEEESS